MTSDQQNLNEAFALLDTDHDGRLSRTELAAVFRAINVEPSRIEMDSIFKEMDTDATGKISKEEFIRYMSEPPKHRTQTSELEQQFKLLDTDGDGYVTFGNYLK
uniref:Calmodulin n=1 Tax=Syphacia muris TaxID=451379 RepID=A0A0N5B0E3_9BILA